MMLPFCYNKDKESKNGSGQYGEEKEVKTRR